MTTEAADRAPAALAYDPNELLLLGLLGAVRVCPVLTPGELAFRCESVTVLVKDVLDDGQRDALASWASRRFAVPAASVRITVPGPPETGSPAGPAGGQAGAACPPAEREDTGPRPAGPAGHICLTCGSVIAEGEDEVPVPLGRCRLRYRHAEYTGCQSALRRSSWPNNSLIGVYSELLGPRTAG